MTVYVDDGDFRLLHGDALEALATLPDESVDCCVTSPPYWGLRDYGTGSWDGGDPDCDHSAYQRKRNADSQPGTGNAGVVLRDGVPPMACKCGARRVDHQLGLEPTPDLYVQQMVNVFREVRRVLKDCGTLWLNLGDSYGSGTTADRNPTSTTGPDVPASWSNRSQPQRNGLKPKDLVGIPWRVAFALQADGWYLRSDIIWAKPNPMPESVTDRPTKAHEFVFLLAKGQWKSRVVPLSDLDGERLHLKQDIGAKNAAVWAHEFGVRLATAILDSPQLQNQLGLSALDSEEGQKRLRSLGRSPVGGIPVEHRAAVYAARLLAADGTAKEFLCELDRFGVTLANRHDFCIAGTATKFALPPGVDPYGKTAIAIHDAGEIGEVDFTAHTLKFSRPSGCSYFFDQEAVREPHTPDGRKQTLHIHATDNSHPNYDNIGNGNERWPNGGRNVRSVWEIATQPYSEAHFATYPEELVRRCILAGTSERGVCPECGKPWERETQQGENIHPGDSGRNDVQGPAQRGKRPDGKAIGTVMRERFQAGRGVSTLGWRPSCDCHGDRLACSSPVPATVLDPFGGSGTTALVARKHGRHSILIELSEDYCELAARRLSQLSLLTGAV